MPVRTIGHERVNGTHNYLAWNHIFPGNWEATTKATVSFQVIAKELPFIRALRGLSPRARLCHRDCSETQLLSAADFGSCPCAGDVAVDAKPTRREVPFWPLHQDQEPFLSSPTSLQSENRALPFAADKPFEREAARTKSRCVGRCVD